MLCNKDFLVGCHINSWSWRLLMLTQTSNKHSLRLEYFLFQFKRGVSRFGASTLSVLKKTHSRVVLDTSKATNDQNSQNTRFKLLCVSIHLTIIFQSVFFDWYIYIFISLQSLEKELPVYDKRYHDLEKDFEGLMRDKNIKEDQQESIGEEMDNMRFLWRSFNKNKDTKKNR